MPLETMTTSWTIYSWLINDLALRELSAELPEGLCTTCSDGEKLCLFSILLRRREVWIWAVEYLDMLTNEQLTGYITPKGYGIKFYRNS